MNNPIADGSLFTLKLLIADAILFRISTLLDGFSLLGPSRIRWLISLMRTEMAKDAMNESI